MTTAKKKRVLVVGAIVIAMTIVFRTLLSGNPEAADHSSSTPAIPKDNQKAPTKAGNHAAKPLVAKPPPSVDSHAPIVDEVIVEKEEVCEGEENLVTVKAHTPDGTDAFLHYLIGTEAGPQVPVRGHLGSDGKTATQTLTVFGRNNVPTIVKIPAYKIKQCENQRLAVITVRAPPNTVDEYELMVRMAEGNGAKPFKAVRFLWSFGDGETAVTDVPIVDHSYVHRAQKTAFSSYLIRVEVLSESGESATGRYSLTLRNAAFDARQRGRVAIFAAPHPRFPRMLENAKIQQNFQIWHYEDEPVDIVSIKALKLYTVNANTTPPAPEIQEIDPQSIFSDTEIPPGNGVQVSVTFDFSVQDLYAVTYRLVGLSFDGREAFGDMGVVKPPPKPTRENSQSVSDPQLLAKIRKAMAILRQDTVSREEIWRLEREGKL